MRFLLLSCVPILFAVQGNTTVVLDRVAIVVGRHAVKTSDIERDLRGSQFLNRQKLDVSDAARKKVADRLIDQELIRQEMENGSYSEPRAADVDAFVDRIRQDRFAGSAARFHSALAQYGLTPEQFREYVRWQLMVLRFIDERFRPSVLVTDEDVQAYYEQHRAEFAKANPNNHTLEALTPKIRQQITGERVNQNFDEWLKQTRRQTRIDYRPTAFGESASSGGGVKP